MDVVTDHGTLFQASADRKSASSLMVYVTVANPSGPTTLACAGLRVGYEIEEGVRSKEIK